MRTPEQVRWDFVQQWLAKAEQDLRAGRVILQADLEDFETVGFHAQQAAEKFLKALLVRHQIEVPKTHNIPHLRGLDTVRRRVPLSRRPAPGIEGARDERHQAR